MEENIKIVDDALTIRKKHPGRHVLVGELRSEKVSAFFSGQLLPKRNTEGLTFYVASEGRLLRVTVEDLR